MTKRAQYDLSFYNSTSPRNGRITNICKKNGEVNRYSVLQILQNLDKPSTIAFIDEINNALNGKYYEEFFTSDGIEHEGIQLLFPNVIFGENDLTIAMTDLKELLEEWLDFIS